MDELNKTAERNTELEARIGFMLSSRQVTHISLFSSTIQLIVASGIRSNLQLGAHRQPKFFLVCPPLFSCAPPRHMRGHNDCLLPTERQLKCPLVLALQSAGEVGRGAIKVMGPSAVCLADFSVTRN